MATEFTEKAVKDYLLAHGGRVKNTDLVTHFKKFLNDPNCKDEMRGKFKNYVNTLATVKENDQKEKILMLKKKYRDDKGHFDNPSQSEEEPPIDHSDGAVFSDVKSEENLSSAELQLIASTYTSENNKSTCSEPEITSPNKSQSNQEDDNNASVLSVKERAKHLNRIESESEIQKTSASDLGAVRHKEHKKVRDSDEDSSSETGTYQPLNALEKEWLVKCSDSKYHLMNELLSKNPHLAAVKEFTSTALHWAAKKGCPEVIKMLIGKPGVNVNQRTGYTPLHLAAIQGHEEIIELLIQTFKADPNMRDYSGKKAKQYLNNSASSRVQHLLVSTRLSSKSGNDKVDASFLRNSTSRRSNRDSAIKSLIRVSTGAMKQTMMKTGLGSSEDIISEKNERIPKVSPRNSAEPSPVIQRRSGSYRNLDCDLMPPPNATSRHAYRYNQHSSSRESLHSEDKRQSLSQKVPRSESEPNLEVISKSSKSTFI